MLLAANTASIRDKERVTQVSDVVFLLFVLTLTRMTSHEAVYRASHSSFWSLKTFYTRVSFFKTWEHFSVIYTCWYSLWDFHQRFWLKLLCIETYSQWILFNVHNYQAQETGMVFLQCHIFFPNNFKCLEQANRITVASFLFGVEAEIRYSKKKKKKKKKKWKI